MDAPTLVAGITDLASLPGACLRVMALADDPKASAGDLAEVIAHDPGLAARLLKLVNSAYYGLREPVDSLDVAVRVCGTEALRSLALATGAVSAFKDIPNDLVDMGAFWNASVHCGLLARALGRIARLTQPERLFAAGLLHAVGQIVMYNRLPTESRAVLDVLRRDLHARSEAERRVFGYTYAEVSAALLASWGLPPSLVEPVACHLAPAAAAEFGRDAALLHIAREVTLLVEPGIKTEAREPRPSPAIDTAVWTQAQLVPAVLPSALEQVDAQWFEVIDILNPGGSLAY
ncbi:MAG TPA: HDOD domain-containing protein [Gammaproteobacteria bacterium]|nr:HDOD domain-containing protein [Gammaproteobacteria bacterium]